MSCGYYEILFMKTTHLIKIRKVVDSKKITHILNNILYMRNHVRIFYTSLNNKY